MHKAGCVSPWVELTQFALSGWPAYSPAALHLNLNQANLFQYEYEENYISVSL